MMKIVLAFDDNVAQCLIRKNQDFEDNYDRDSEDNLDFEDQFCFCIYLRKSVCV